jgi:hypothetical protein
LQTAPGQVVEDNSSRGAGRPRARRARRLPVSTTTLAIAGILAVLSIGIMLLALLGIWPPKSTQPNESITDVWTRIRTATPAWNYATGLTIEKIGAPRKEGDNVIVRLRVTNNVKVPAALEGTPTPGAATPTPGPANLYNGTVVVVFYNEEGGRQKIVGSGLGNVTDLAYGQSKEIDVVATAVEGFSEATKFESFPDSVWTDKDPVKASTPAP